MQSENASGLFAFARIHDSLSERSVDPDKSGLQGLSAFAKSSVATEDGGASAPTCPVEFLTKSEA